MSDFITVKVTQQMHHLQYKGRRQKTLTDGSVQALNRILGKSGASLKAESTGTMSSMLWKGVLDGPAEHDAGPLEMRYEPMLAAFHAFDEPSARRAQKAFFAAVEAGKKGLYEKFGNRIPGSEIDRLSSELSAVSADIWYIQIITTRVGDQQFTGSHKRRSDSKWSASVKSMTIYRHSPLSDEQIQMLIRVLEGLEKYEDAPCVARLRKTDMSMYEAFVSPTGRVIFRTPPKDDMRLPMRE